MQLISLSLIPHPSVQIFLNLKCDYLFFAIKPLSSTPRTTLEVKFRTLSLACKALHDLIPTSLLLLEFSFSPVPTCTLASITLAIPGCAMLFHIPTGSQWFIFVTHLVSYISFCYLIILVIVLLHKLVGHRLPSCYDCS